MTVNIKKMTSSKKKIELFIEVHSEREFENILKNNTNQLICAEVYSYAFGFCTALDRLFTIIKLDWSDGKIILLKICKVYTSLSVEFQTVPADVIKDLRRFQNQSQPVYLFIRNMKVTKVFRGVNMVNLAEVAKKELQFYREEQDSLTVNRVLYELDEPTSDELEWIASTALDRERELKFAIIRLEARQAARKRHRAELMVPYLTDLNFVLYWPHCWHAHPELYERWDDNSIVMVGREVVNVTEKMVRDIFYAGDAPLNEASLHKLHSGQSLALCLRLLNSTESFTGLVRKILYEEIHRVPNDTQAMMTAYDYYKSYSPTKEEIIQQRQQEKETKRADYQEKRTRRLSVMQRLARQALEDAVEAKRVARENRKLELLKAGNLSGLQKFNENPQDDEIDIVVPEELSDGEEISSSEEEDPDAYFPPSGLLIPGFYAPPTDIGKVNALAVLFPKLVAERVTPQPEFLPPHVLVMLEIHKRFRAIEAISRYKNSILHMGIFKAVSPYDSSHIAYTVKEYETVDKDSLNLEDIKIAFMISIESDIPLLQLVDLNPSHVSRDEIIGEEECAAMFPVSYCDDYNQFEDF